MQAYDNDFEPTSLDTHLIEHVKNLETVKFQIAELRIIQEKIEYKVLELSGRVDYNDMGEMIAIEKEGASTALYGQYKVTIDTGYIYAIDKEEYHVFRGKLPEQYDPIKTSVKYDVDKRKLRDAEKYASDAEKIILSQIISKKFSKPSIKIVLNA